jgi:hypothetical protein
MSSQEEIFEQQERLQIYRRTLAHYLNQLAVHGTAYVPPSIAFGINETREAIQRIKRILRTWGVDVEDNPDDVHPTTSPSHREEDDEEEVNSRQKKLELIVQTLREEGIELSPEVVMSAIQLLKSPLKAEETTKRLEAIIQTLRSGGHELTLAVIIPAIKSTY